MIIFVVGKCGDFIESTFGEGFRISIKKTFKILKLTHFSFDRKLMELCGGTFKLCRFFF